MAQNAQCKLNDQSHSQSHTTINVMLAWRVPNNNEKIYSSPIQCYRWEIHMHSIKMLKLNVANKNDA
jgi:hypothetical protein